MDTRKGSKLTLLVWTAGGLLLLAATRSDACSCMAFPEDAAEAAELAYARADAVFVGEITALEDTRSGSFDYLHARFDVQKSWKGVRAGSSIALRTALSSAGCGYPFRRSRSYLVFAYHDSEGDVYTTSLCDLNLVEEAATEHIRALNSLAAAGAHTGTEDTTCLLRPRSPVRDRRADVVYGLPARISAISSQMLALPPMPKCELRTSRFSACGL